MKIKRVNIAILLLLFSFCIDSYSNYKVYLIHGYAGNGIELKKIQRSIKRAGYTYEYYTYNSFTHDIDSVAKILFTKIQWERYDTISFVTHSMGALVVRALYEHIGENVLFPHIHRIVMIAPPNKGTPIADYYSQFKIINSVFGPNISNMTTDSLSGPDKYPIPNCELGIIIGAVKVRRFFSGRLEGADDGFISLESSTLGIDEDVRIVRASHVGLLFNRKVSSLTLEFLDHGKFLDT